MYLQRCGEIVLNIRSIQPGNYNSENYVYYDAVASLRLAVLNTLYGCFSSVYTSSEIKLMEILIELHENIVYKKDENWDAKMKVSRVIHAHLSEVAKLKENSPLMREVDLLLQSNPFNRNR